MSRLEETAAAIIRVASRLDAKGILTATDGNLSARLSDGTIVVTPSGCCKGMLGEKELIVLRPDGSIDGEKRPTSELALHRAIYAADPSIGGIVHAHPPYATAYAVAGIPLDRPILSEAVLVLGEVPVAPYATPTREELAHAVEGLIEGHSAILLRHHGVVAWSSDIEHAGYVMETVEHVAKIDFIRRSLGSAAELSPVEVEHLLELKHHLG